MLRKFFGLIVWFLYVNFDCFNGEEAEMNFRSFNGTVLNLTEGSNCTYGDKQGRCVNFFKCERLVVDLPRKRYPTICSFDGEVPIVCCTSCKLVNNIDDAVKVSSGKIYFKNGDKSRDKCLQYSKYAVGKCKELGEDDLFWSSESQCHYLGSAIGLAAGGRDAARGEFAHTAILGYGQLENIQWYCAGTLISEKFVLTVAHCAKSDSFGPVTYIGLGILHRNDSSELWNRYRVKTIIQHPEYKPPAKYHDIALLETEEKIRFGPSVLPACLPNPKEFVNDPSLLQDSDARLESDLRPSAAGWGIKEFRKELANTLQVVNLRGFTEEECLEHYPPHTTIPHGYNKTTQLCFGGREKPISTCIGDSGGPLQILNSFCMYTVLGVTSFGRACGFPGNASIYSRIVYYLPWIEDIIWKEA